MGKWPHDYYGLIETGLVSQIMGIRVIGDSPQKSLKSLENMLNRVKSDWPNIAKFETADQIIGYLYDHDLASIAGAIQKTFFDYRAAEPGGEYHLQLQAMAVKRGLVAAYREVQNRLSGKTP